MKTKQKTMRILIILVVAKIVQININNKTKQKGYLEINQIKIVNKKIRFKI